MISTFINEESFSKGYASNIFTHSNFTKHQSSKFKNMVTLSSKNKNVQLQLVFDKLLRNLELQPVEKVFALNQIGLYEKT